MENLIQSLGRIWMDGYDQDQEYDEVEDKLEDLESDNTSARQKYDELIALDAEVDNGYNPLFYATLCLSNRIPDESWLGRLIHLAESIEDEYPELRRRLFTTKDHEDKTILMLLIEVERDDSETTGEPLRLNYIQFLLQKYRAVGAETEIQEAQQFCNNEGIGLTLNTLGGKRRKSKRTKRLRYKSRKCKKLK